MQATLDASTVDLTRTRARICASVTFTPQVYGDTTFYHVEQTEKSVFFRVGYAEYVFLSLLDGETSFCQALAITAQKLGADALPQAQALTLYTWALEQKITEFNERDCISDFSGTTTQSKAGTLAKLNPFWIRIPFGRPQEFLKLLSPIVGWLFSPISTCVGLGIILLATIRLSVDWTSFAAASENVFATDNWLWLLVAWIGLKTIHELAHGVVCQRYGGEVRETGVVLAFFAPLAFVDVTSCWSFRSRWQRIHTALAGMYVELLFAAFAVFVWTTTESTVVRHLMYNVIIMASFSTIVFNANPLMRFDGYYVLSDLLQIPNLYTRASEAATQFVSRLLFGIKDSAPSVAGRVRWTLIAYGIAATCWRVFICLTMMIAASVLFHGAGVMLSVAGVVAWFAVPLVNSARKITRIARVHPMRVVRATIVTSSLVIFVVTVLFFAPVPFNNTAPGIVSLPDGCIIRPEVDGFVEQIHIQNGQSVRKGDVLVTLRNDEVRLKHNDLLLQYEQERIRYQTALQEHDDAEAAIVESNLRSLKEQQRETKAEVDALTVRAANSGVVVSRDLHLKTETFVREGDELLAIDDQESRELRISLAQEDFAVVDRLAGRTADVRIGSRSPSTGTIDHVIPRASRRLRYPALAATEGGSLSVTAASDDDPELTEQRFEAIVRLGDVGKRMPIGERGYVAIPNNHRTLVAWIWYGCRSWVRRQVSMAESAT